jgi:putative transcription antitermination factor YqgF
MPVILCLDPGTAHTGLAISQEGILATPVATIFEKDIDRLVGKLIPYLTRFSPDRLVIGVPEYGPIVNFSRDLSERINKIFPGEIIFYQEDLSSGAARKTMKELRKTLVKRKKEEHQTAAALILQDYLDSLQ